MKQQNDSNIICQTKMKPGNAQAETGDHSMEKFSILKQRKELKRNSHRVVRSHYFILFFLTLVMILFGTEYSYVKESWSETGAFGFGDDEADEDDVGSVLDSRTVLDSIMEGRPDLHPSSSGKCSFFFVPDLEKTFNRGFTDYFLRQRQPMASFATQKSLGKRLGKVKSVGNGSITLNTREPLTSGDGLCFFNSQGQLEGFLVNRVQGNTFFPNRMPQDIAVGTTLWRNNDQSFNKLLQANSASRMIGVTITVSDTDNGLRLEMVDAEGCRGESAVVCDKQPARQPERALEQIEKQVSKLGDTVFEVTSVSNQCKGVYFIPAAVLNELRRQAVSQLEANRIADHMQRRGHSGTLAQRLSNHAPYISPSVDYRANILNAHTESFYRRHGVEQLEYGLEKTLDYEGKSLMTTKYCLRYELGCCLKGKSTGQSRVIVSPGDTLYLNNNRNWFRLDFDCRQCQMTLTAVKAPFQQEAH